MGNETTVSHDTNQSDTQQNDTPAEDKNKPVSNEHCKFNLRAKDRPPEYVFWEG